MDALSELPLAGPEKVGLMKLEASPAGEYRYAIAVRDGPDLWLTAWVKRTPKPEFFLMIPRAKADGWDAHTSYHVDGAFHMKSFGRKFLAQTRQRLDGPFRGTETLGEYQGHGPKAVGAICDPAAFNGVVEVAPGVLGPQHGAVVVDLVEPGCEPIEFLGEVLERETFRDFIPWLVIRIGRKLPPVAPTGS